MSELALLFAAVRLATPLALASLGELVAERAGVLNIGIEGMMLAGACAAYLVGVESGSAPLAVLAAAGAGSALAAVFAAFVVGRRADPIVCGTALNLLALGLTGSLYRAWLPPGALAPPAPGLGAWLGVHAFVWMGAALAVGVALFLGHSRLGLLVRACGEGASAARSQGVPVRALRLSGALFGGLCAGVAGAALVLWISDRFVESITGGRGFIALALVLFGAHRVRFILAGAVLFGLAGALVFRLQAAGLAIPYNLLLMLPYVLTLAVLALGSRRARPPADLARPLPET